jgi:hypothetical protein
MDSGSELKAFCKSAGADFAGIADLDPFQQGRPTLPADLLTPFRLDASREEALFFGRCADKTYENSLLPGIGARICVRALGRLGTTGFTVLSP